MKKVFVLFFALLLGAAAQVQAEDMQAASTPADKPRMVVFVVGVEQNQVGDFLAILVGNELGGGDRYDIITRTDAVQKKLKELREYERSGNVNEGELIEWGRQNNVSMLCLVTSIHLDEYMFAAQLTDVKSNKLVGSGDYSSASLGSADLKKVAGALAAQIQGNGGGSSSSMGQQASSGSRASSRSSGGKSNGAAYNPDGIELVYVAGIGSGIMATKGFYIGKYEVTQAQWQAIMGSNPSAKQDPFHPVTNVSWNDCKQFLAKLNEQTGRSYRLPTEAEWVYAANGGSNGDTYEYAGSNNADEVAWHDGNSGWYSGSSASHTHKVGTKQPNSAGIYDMSGNVWEWCEDWYDSNHSDRVGRGGSWYGTAASCRVAYRNSSTPGYSYNILGFRLVLP
ncbi:MAG: formylglycine-generating enzyme family protein [Prevotellaceae bacterium]|jgi:hypothetical protein|nr:formylglycine-generating enzyme family protein [Prevotellaceae bacterium]